MRLPPNFLRTHDLSPTPDGPLNRRLRRASLVSFNPLYMANQYDIVHTVIYSGLAASNEETILQNMFLVTTYIVIARLDLS